MLYCSIFIVGRERDRERERRETQRETQRDRDRERQRERGFLSRLLQYEVKKL